MQCRLLSGSVLPVNRAAAALSTTLPRLPHVYAPARIRAHTRNAVHSVNTRATARSFLTSTSVLSSSKNSPSSSAWSPFERLETEEEQRVTEEADGDTSTNSINIAREDTSNGLRPTFQDALDPDFRPYGSASRRALRGRRRLSSGARSTARNPDDDEEGGDGPFFLARDPDANGAWKKYSLDSDWGMAKSPKLPDRFYSRYLLSPDNLRQSPAQAQVSVKRAPAEDNDSFSESFQHSRYTMHPALYTELHSMLSSSLNLQPQPGITNPLQAMSNLTLHYPGENGTTFLDHVLRKLALDQDANLLTLNADDIAELFNHIIAADSKQPQPFNNNSPPHSTLLANDMSMNGIAWLGYNVYRPDPNSFTDANINRDDNDDAEDIDENDTESGEDIMEITPGSRSNLPNFLKILPLFKPGNGNAPGMGPGGFPGHSIFSSDKIGVDPNSMMSKVISQVVNAALAFETSGRPTDAEIAASEAVSKQTTNPSPKSSRGLVIQIQDYDNIAETIEGKTFLATLEKQIHSRRLSGERVVLVPTSSPTVGDETLGTGKAYARNIEHGLHFSCYPHQGNFRRTVMVVPDMPKDEVDKVLLEDEKTRVKGINLRHLRTQLMAGLKASAIDETLISDANMGLNEDLLKELKISDGFWTYRKVHKIAGIALGLYAQRGADAKMEVGDITKALEISEQVDAFKDEWLSKRAKSASSVLTTLPTENMDTEEGRKAALEQAEKQRRLQLKELHKKCNTHEQKLLGGVVDAKNIRTTFSDVHVPVETKDTLKTLTSLSLIRPDAFTYGVLATDKIPGCLLYGPPGTGKTMLAKAVAKQSGATVLEISGSDVYDMYVGEGEKNVRAIFTLAKKLSPCIVFIDEADAIFGMRTTGANGGVHRELINQFLREWDGMEDMSAFIMVATNRPFDLDDAVLRRLPRRLLVDLPTEQDRKEILTIHLKDEQLAEGIDLADLAKRTPFYSGSDLKNLCVAAALACVKEEMDVAQTVVGGSVASTPSTPPTATSAGDTSSSVAEPKSEATPKYPARRTLQPTHFEQAMEEISASISEDMSSLTAIKKFDEKYGDKRSKRKKTRSWGFAVSEEEEKDSARVRK
ncbi:hypothetical protein KEM56_001910 [Ascosphaera pollenicola]|nr:hypothetical protein KEM56_001910 [Ascosphaera pollenicola]